MAPVWFIPFVAIAVLSITALLFVGWATVMTIKGVVWIFGALFIGPLVIWRRQIERRGACTECGQMNPASARFCRRCGSSLRNS